MHSLDQVATQYRSLRFRNIAEELEQLVNHEIGCRDTKRIAQNMHRAGFPLHKILSELDYRVQTTVTKRDVNALLDFTSWHACFCHVQDQSLGG